jgi:predicted XRE-type DNA-binding protein
MVERGRSTLGERNPQAKLTEANVVAIRQSNLSQRALAEQLGVTPGLISQIRSRKIWKHI